MGWFTNKRGDHIKSDEEIYGQGSMSNTSGNTQQTEMREKELSDYAEEISEEQYQKLEKDLAESGRMEQTGLNQIKSILISNQPPRIKLERMKLFRKSPYYKKLEKEQKEDVDLALQTLEGLAMDSEPTDHKAKTKDGQGRKSGYDEGLEYRLDFRTQGGGY